jgi:hypothetical protein
MERAAEGTDEVPLRPFRKSLRLRLSQFVHAGDRDGCDRQ